MSNSPGETRPLGPKLIAMSLLMSTVSPLLRLWIMQAHGSLLGGAQGSWQALTSHAQPRGSKEKGSGTIADGRDGNTSGHGRRRGCPRHSCLMGLYVNTSGHGRRRVCPRHSYPMGLYVNTSGHGRRRVCLRHSYLMGSYVNTSGPGRRRGLRDRRLIFSEPISKKGGFRCLILNKKE